MKIVFVHGRAQEHKDPEELKREWISALEAGLRNAQLDLSLNADDITLPYFGNCLFDLTENLDQIERDMVAKGAPVSDPALMFEAEALTEMAAKAGISDQDILAGMDTNVGSKGPANWAWVRGVVRAIDRWSGGLSAQAIRLILRDVFVYNTRSGIAAEIDGLLGETLTEQPTVVVSHSLGTVVAYNVLRRETRPLHVPLFVTLGSPLGISAVRRQLVPLRSPKVASWFNAFDPRDIVALNHLDGGSFPVRPEIENKGDVDNFTANRHGISGYLGDPDVARRIHAALTL